MKKLIFVFAILCLCFGGTVGAKEVCKYGEGDLFFDNSEQIMIETLTGQPANGLSCISYRKKFKGCFDRLQYKGGKLEGIARFSGGGDETEVPYKDNKIEGVARVFSQSRLIWEMPYENSKAEGTAKFYYESGKLKGEYQYRNDQREGIARNYYESGELFSEILYEGDKIEGVAKFFYNHGKLKEEIPYKDGKTEGYHNFYTKDGKPLCKILYGDDKTLSGTCADGRALTNAELSNFEKGFKISCGSDSIENYNKTRRNKRPALPCDR